MLAAASASYIGDRFNTIALIALSYELSESALGVGGMLALLALPRLVVQGPAGALVDRYPGKWLLVGTQLLMGIVAAAFALLVAIPSIWLLYGLTLLMGVLRTVDTPAFEVRLMALTPSDKRATANAVHSLAMTAGELIGPLLGGLVLVWVGAAPLFLLNGLSFVFVAAAVASLPERVAGSEPEPEEGEADTSTGGYLTLLRRRGVALYTALVAASCMLLLGAIALFVVRAIELGLGEGGVGLFYTILGVGTLIGGIALGAARSPYPPRAHRDRRRLHPVRRWPRRLWRRQCIAAGVAGPRRRRPDRHGGGGRGVDLVPAPAARGPLRPLLLALPDGHRRRRAGRSAGRAGAGRDSWGRAWRSRSWPPRRSSWRSSSGYERGISMTTCRLSPQPSSRRSSATGCSGFPRRPTSCRMRHQGGRCWRRGCAGWSNRHRRQTLGVQVLRADEGSAPWTTRTRTHPHMALRTRRSRRHCGRR